MNLQIILIEDSEEGGFTAYIPDIPVYGEGESKKEAIADLKDGLSGYIETFGLEEATTHTAASMEVQQIDWNLAELAHG